MAAAIIGLALTIVPSVRHVSEGARASLLIVGPLVASTAFVALWEVLRPLRWLLVPFGLWLVVSPLAVEYREDWTLAGTMMAGIVLMLLAPGRGSVGSRMGGGWRAILRAPDRESR